MRRGVEVIHQAALVGDGIGGYADFLERAEQRSQLGEWSYAVSVCGDGKLSSGKQGCGLRRHDDR